MKPYSAVATDQSLRIEVAGKNRDLKLSFAGLNFVYNRLQEKLLRSRHGPFSRGPPWRTVALYLLTCYSDTPLLSSGYWSFW